MIGDSNEQSGTVGFLIGIIVLVFVGIAFSLLVDKRFRFSSGRATLEETVQDQKRIVERMEGRLETLRREWEKEVRPFEGQAEEIKITRETVRSTAGELVRLQERRKLLEEQILSADKAFRDYRTGYRKQVRLAAAGEELGELSSRGGRTYQGVTITRVIPEGMEIRHSHGISRLRPEDLAPSWQERFQWHPEELQKPPVPAKAPEAVVAEVPAEEAAEDPVSPEEQAAAAEARKLAALRRDVTEARRFASKAEAELARARSESRNARGASVPGSLETWADKVRRLESTAAKFQAQLATARGKLAAAAPGDPLLQEPAGR